MNTRIVGTSLVAVIMLVGAGCAGSEPVEEVTPTPEPIVLEEVVEAPTPAPTSTPEVASSTVFDASQASSTAYTLEVDSSSMTWLGKKRVGNDHVGTVLLQSGVVSLSPTLLPVSGMFVIDMMTIESDEDLDSLEEHLKNEDFFAVDVHPTANFVITDATATSDDTVLLVGDLTIKGITSQIEFEASIVPVDDTSVQATGAFSIDRATFDIRYGSESFFSDLGDSVIEDEIDFTLDLIASIQVAE